MRISLTRQVCCSGIAHLLPHWWRAQVRWDVLMLWCFEGIAWCVTKSIPVVGAPKFIRVVMLDLNYKRQQHLLIRCSIRVCPLPLPSRSERITLLISHTTIYPGAQIWNDDSLHLRVIPNWSWSDNLVSWCLDRSWNPNLVTAKACYHGLS